MATLEELRRDLARALDAGDLDRAASLRSALVAEHPESPDAAEAHFKLGLDALLRRRDLDQAAAAFREAAKAKDATWSQQARVSLGLVLARQGKHQQAAFELRRVAAARPPSLVSAQAAGFLVLTLRGARQGAEAERVRTDQLKQLEALTRSTAAGEAGYAHLLLGVERKHDGDRVLARRHLEAALASGALPAAERAHAERSLRAL